MDQDENLEGGRKAVPLEPSSPVDPRAQLPEAERQTETWTLANGAVVTSYTEPPLASDYSANRPDPDAYEAFLDEVIAEADAELEGEEREAHERMFDRWGKNNLRQLIADEQAEKAAEAEASDDVPTDPPEDRWASLR